MKISTGTLVKIAGWGGIVVATTGIYLKNKLIENAQSCQYYKTALKKLRTNAGAVHYLGEPIKDQKFKLSDAVNNYADAEKARFCIPVVGPKDKGLYYFWAEKSGDEWKVVRAELELNSKPDHRLVILNENIS